MSFWLGFGIGFTYFGFIFGTARMCGLNNLSEDE